MDPRTLLSKQTESFQSPALRQLTLDVQKVNGINLGQGVCNLPVPELVRQQATAAIEEGINRYTSPRGLSSLREAVASKLQRHNALTADPETEILISAGVTAAFEAVCAVLLNPGDEVIVLEPTYPYHIQALRRYQAGIRHLTLEAPDWAVDFDELRRLVTPKTKFLVLNTPGNPTGRVFSREELLEVAGILEGTSCLLVTDEIYEYMTFDGRHHVSPASMPELRDRTITMGGYSKTFSITGWRIGYAVASPALAAVMTSALDAMYACPPAPLQEAVARGIQGLDDGFYQRLNAKYESKRNLFAKGLRDIGLEPLTPQGAYYMVCGYENSFPGMDSYSFVRQMIATAGVGAVPSVDFVRDHEHAHWVRFCLAHEDSVLEQALGNLRQMMPS